MELPGANGAWARRPRSFVRVTGKDAAAFLQRLLSNDVQALAAGDSCEALLLTAKARVIAPMRVWRRGEDDFLLLTEPELGETLAAQLLRVRFAAKVEIAVEEHASHVVLGSARADGIANADYAVPAVEVLDGEPPPGLAELPEGELEALRILARTPRFGREIDDRVLPAEAGLTERAVSFTKGCYPGQEPIARLHYRGHANRGLRVLALEGDEPPAYDVELRDGEKAVGRVTSAARLPDGTIVVLAYVRNEVAEDAVLVAGRSELRPLDFLAARP